jgi:hypothetical protein
MRRIARYLFYSLFTFCNACLHAQTTQPKKDTLFIPADSSRFSSFQEIYFRTDSTIALTQRISHPLDQFQFMGYRQHALGNLGAPSSALQWPLMPIDAFRRGINEFGFFGYSDNNRNYYLMKSPYTFVRYAIGQRRASETEAIHSHNFGRNCNLTFGFLRQRAEGFYNRQNTNNTSVRLNGWFWTPSHRYGLVGDLYWTSHDVQENGGILNEQFFENTTQLDRKLVPVNLSSAETKQRVRSGRIKQYWAFGAVVDTLIYRLDSTQAEKDTLQLRTVILPRTAITHAISFRDESYSYRDGNPTSGFYPTIYRDSLKTLDSTGIWRLQNELFFEVLSPQSTQDYHLFGKLGLRHELGRLRNDTIREDFQNIYVDAVFGGPWIGSTDAHYFFLKGWFIPSGFNRNNWKVEAMISERSLIRQTEIQIFAQADRIRPGYLYTNYSGNHFRWENDFSQEQKQRIGIALTLKTRSWIKLTAAFCNAVSPVYFDTTRLPAQWNGSIAAANIQVQHELNGRTFRWRGTVDYYRLPTSTPIRLPELIVRQSAYLQFQLFKKSLLLQAGIDAEWFSAYYADAYNPNIAQFYLQNTKEIGNYLYLDPWVSFKIKPVRIFIKADHVNAGLFGRRYYLLPRYPQNDLALHLGISWLFND